MPLAEALRHSSTRVQTATTIRPISNAAAALSLNNQNPISYVGACIVACNRAKLSALTSLLWLVSQISHS